jgi:SWI/SNF-related matrix-associated actin-dependent regulator of chromatin subfamily D
MQQTPLDGFSVRRTGDSPTNIRVIIHLEQNPEVFTLSEDLC